MPGIANIEIYNESMTKSLIDKLFFLDKIDNVKCIVDYGCANGALIAFIAPLFPDILFFGYDKNGMMIDSAIEKNKNNKNAYFSQKINALDNFLNEKNLKRSDCALLLSSIIHEIYSYLTKDEVWDFWKYVNDSGFKYIIIRDMCVNEAADRSSLKEDVIKVKALSSRSKLKQFESFFGSVDNNKNLIHYLLKTPFSENWEREVRENYLPHPVEYIAGMVYNPEYELIYFDNYILPYVAERVKKDFDITIKDYTHVKFIWKRRNNLKN